MCSQNTCFPLPDQLRVPIAQQHRKAAKLQPQATPLSPAPGASTNHHKSTQCSGSQARRTNLYGPGQQNWPSMRRFPTAQHITELLGSSLSPSRAFAVSTLQMYPRACHVFVDFMATTASPSGKPCMDQIGVATLADYMLACTASKEEDREVHLMSPSSSIKALRWIAKTLDWHALSQAMLSSVIMAYGRQSREFDRKEATPIPLALLAHWERTLCTPQTYLTTKLFLGAVLLCTHASLRFGDAQRIEWQTLQLSAQGLHGTAYATKTTKCGQPFACTWHGITGRCTQSSWLLQWLSCLVEVGMQATLEPDFMFFHADLGSHKHPQTFPCSYSHALLCLRFEYPSTARRSHCCGIVSTDTAQHEVYHAGSSCANPLRRAGTPRTGTPP